MSQFPGSAPINSRPAHRAGRDSILFGPRDRPPAPLGPRSGCRWLLFRVGAALCGNYLPRRPPLGPCPPGPSIEGRSARWPAGAWRPEPCLIPGPGPTCLPGVPSPGRVPLALQPGEWHPPVRRTGPCRVPPVPRAGAGQAASGSRMRQPGPGHWPRGCVALVLASGRRCRSGLEPTPAGASWEVDMPVTGVRHRHPGTESPAS